MSELTFGHESYLYYLFFVPLFCAVIIAARMLEKKQIQSLGEGITRHLAFRWSTPRFIARVVLFSLGVSFLLIAAAKPRWGYSIKEVPQFGSDVMVLFDVSRSMNAADVSPSRMARAKRKLLDVIAGLKGERLGIVAFAGRAFVHCPLSDDKAMLGLFVDSLSDDLISYQGTNLSEAAKIAVQSLETAQAKDSAGKKLVVMTDGEDFSGEASAVKSLIQDKNIQLAILGLGTPEGSPVKLPDGTLLKDQNGSVVISKLAEKDLVSLAESVGGLYVRSVASDRDVEAILSKLIGLEETETRNQEKIWNEVFQTFLLIGFVCLILGWLLTPYLAISSAASLLLGASSLTIFKDSFFFFLRMMSCIFLIVLSMLLKPSSLNASQIDSNRGELDSGLSGKHSERTSKFAREKVVETRNLNDLQSSISFGLKPYALQTSTAQSLKLPASASQAADPSASNSSTSDSTGNDSQPSGAKAPFSKVSQDPERLYSEKKFIEAASGFEAKASEFDPRSMGHLQGLYNAAVAHYEAMQYDEAIAGFQKAAESSSKELRRDALFNLANTLVAKGKLEESVGPYKSSLEIDSSFTEAKENLEWVLSQIEEQKQRKNQESDKNQDREKNQNQNQNQNQNSQEAGNGTNDKNPLASSPKGNDQTQGAQNDSQKSGAVNNSLKSGSGQKNQSPNTNESQVGAGSGGNSGAKSEENSSQNAQQKNSADKAHSSASSLSQGQNSPGQKNPADKGVGGQGSDDLSHAKEKAQSAVSLGPGKSLAPKGSAEANAILRQVDENLKVWGVRPRFESQNNHEKDW